MRSLLIVAVLFAGACTKDPPVQEPEPDNGTEGDGVPPDLATAMDGYIGALEAVADAAAAAGPDCVAMAAGLQSAGEAGKPAMEEFESFPSETVDVHMQALNARFGARIDAAVVKLGEAVELCEDDSAVQEQLKAMGLAG